jgi:lysophospholipase L1-like esterase
MVIDPGPPKDHSRFYRIARRLRPVFILVSLLSFCPALASTEASASPSFAATLSYRVAPVATSSEKVSLKIMPLGDSITFGTPDRSYGGYRHALGTLLANDGYIVDFVGSQQSGNKVIPDPDNEGHSGWTIGQIKSGIDANGWLETYQPDIILLHIGTNDVHRGNAASAPGNLSALLDDILARLPQARIIVAQIIAFRWSPDQSHQSYNAVIPGIVASKGPRVSMVDMRNILSRSDYADDLHPNAGGYDKMARAWEKAIRAVVDRGKGVKSRLRVE